MEIIRISESRRFSRERPNRLNILDRSRLVADIVCLEPGQAEARRANSSSDALYLVLEGAARIRAGVQTAELEPNEAALVPPGVEHWLANPGPGRLTALALVAPKPTRASEVRAPAVAGPRREGARARPEPSPTAPPGARGEWPSRGGPAPRWRPEASPGTRGGGREGGRAFGPGMRPAAGRDEDAPSVAPRSGWAGKRPRPVAGPPPGQRPRGRGPGSGRGPAGDATRGGGQRPVPRETPPGRREATRPGRAGPSGRRATGRSGPRTSGRR